MNSLAASAYTLLLAAAAPAGAEPRPAPETDRPAPPAESRGAFEHDGVYVRLGLGFGAFSEGLSSAERDADDQSSQGVVSGVSSVGEIMVGGAVAPRLMLGGGVWSSTVLASDFTQTGGEDVPSELHEPEHFTIVGPFADWYFGRDRGQLGSGGFHAQGGLGLAVLNGFHPMHSGDSQVRLAAGVGVMLGFGYEWWVHEQWGMGVLARLTAAGLVEDDSRDDLWYHGAATFPAVLFTATYN